MTGISEHKIVPYFFHSFENKAIMENSFDYGFACDCVFNFDYGNGFYATATENLTSNFCFFSACSGLINMNQRLYDPVLGRFLAPDPIIQNPENSQNYNKYSYCLNNPLKYNDLTGMTYYFTWSNSSLLHYNMHIRLGGTNANYGWLGWTESPTGNPSLGDGSLFDPYWVDTNAGFGSVGYGGGGGSGGGVGSSGSSGGGYWNYREKTSTRTRCGETYQYTWIKSRWVPEWSSSPTSWYDGLPKERNRNNTLTSQQAIMMILNGIREANLNGVYSVDLNAIFGRSLGMQHMCGKVEIGGEKMLLGVIIGYNTNLNEKMVIKSQHSNIPDFKTIGGSWEWKCAGLSGPYWLNFDYKQYIKNPRGNNNKTLMTIMVHKDNQDTFRNYVYPPKK